MPRFSANLSLLFTEVPLLERFQVAKDNGFDAVEIQFPYEKSAAEIKSAIDKAELELILFNVPAGDLLDGGEGLAGVPERRSSYITAVDAASQFADFLHPKLINILAGRCLQNDRKTEYLETFRGNLGYAAEVFSAKGIQVVFEAINTNDMPGFLVSSGTQMLEILDQVDHPNLYMQYDVYHMQTMGENHADFLNRYANRIGHIQFADAPGRGQPGSGTIDFSGLFEAIDQSGYSGWIGAEYKSTGLTSDSLDWFNNYR